MSIDQTFPHEQNINGVHIQGSQQIFIGRFGNVTVPGRREPEESPEQLCYKALGLFSPYVDYRESVISAKGKRVEGTCEWIQGHKSYHAWLNGDISLLWISGGPGKGKTMMSIFLTEDLEQEILTIENTHLVYYFFSFQDENRNTGVTLLQSLIHQIVTKRPQLKTHLLPYITPGNSQQPQLSLEPLWAIFKKLIQDPKLGTMLCVLDGLDESDKDATQILLPRLIDLLSPTSPSPLSTTFRLIVVSRDILGLEDCTRIKLDPDNNESVHGDIEKFISIRVCDLSKIVGFRHECEREVQATLLKRAEGTFLWVGFAMYELKQKRTWTEVFDALKTLPSGLPAIYSRMLHQIPAERQQTSSRILQWVTMALRPLKLLEIADAIGLESSSSSISREHAMMDEITLCGSFLKVQDSKVTLIHQSVRDYLLDEKQHNNPVLEIFWIKPNEAHVEMAQTCLQCIQQSSLQHGPLHIKESVPRLGESPLLRYAAMHWPEHAVFCSELSADLFDPTRSFFKESSDLRDNWWLTYQKNAGLLLQARSPPLLHIACFLEIIPWVRIIICQDPTSGHRPGQILSQDPINEKDMYGNTALHLSARTGKELSSRFLISHGADMTMKNNEGLTALLYTAESKKDTGNVVQLLLDGGAEIEATDQHRETALQKAMANGNLPVSRTLLDRGANVKAVDEVGKTVLHSAAESGYIGIVQELLGRGAEIHAVDNYGSTALNFAAENGRMDLVCLLLREGAKINVVDKKGMTVLHRATRKAWVSMVQLLLVYGADVKAKDDMGQTVLHTTLSGIKYPGWKGRDWEEGMIELLLNMGADANVRDCFGKTALDLAESRGHESAAALLNARMTESEKPRKRLRR